MNRRTDWKELAMFGGKPLFERPLHVNRPNAVNREHLLELVDGMLEARWFSNGRLVEEFEDTIARHVNVKHCVATCNATRALEIAIRSLDLRGEVIVPSFTFVATVQALRWVGVTPVFCDADPTTQNIDPAQVEKLITARTTAILAVHLWGQPCDIDALQAIADRHRLSLLFDAAHAFGSSYKSKPIGGHGAAEVFSFHATKFVNTGEGGAITTNDLALAKRMRSMRAFGVDPGGNNVDIGTNGKMPEICAAMGLTYLKSLGELLSANQATYNKYESELAGIPGISLLNLGKTGKCNYQYVVTMVEETESGISRDELIKILRAENILAKRYFYPGCHHLAPGVPTDGSHHLPVTEKLVRTVLVLPGGASIDGDEIRGVCETLRLATKNCSQIRKARESRVG
jgi:dTDP-4-amino-4,6-dideoxygalactose transaminase